MFKSVIIVGLGLICGLVEARPDVSLGYRYHPGHSSSGSDFLSVPSQQIPDFSASSSYAPTASGNSYFGNTGAVGQFGSSAASAASEASSGFTGSNLNTQFIPSTPIISQISSGQVSSAASGSSLNTQYSSGQLSYNDQQAFLNYQAPIISKHFYIHSAPEDHDDQQIVRYLNIGRPRKDYKVVFINAPSSTASRAKIIANVAPIEDKTAIYVLSKKANALDVSAEVVTQAPIRSKPEVFFIKYNTPEEAIHAQHTVQAQYDALGGTSEVSDEGLVPVSSVIGSLQGSQSLSTGNTVIQTTNTAPAFDYATDGEQTQNIGSAVSGVSSVSGSNVYQKYLPAQQK